MGVDSDLSLCDKIITISKDLDEITFKEVLFNLHSEIHSPPLYGTKFSYLLI